MGSIGYTAEFMSRQMFNTLRNKIATLPDDVQVGVVSIKSGCGQNNVCSMCFSLDFKQSLKAKAISERPRPRFEIYALCGS